VIFVGGIHGVGKSSFCEEIKKNMSINVISAGNLIAEYKRIEFSSNKLVDEINENQYILIKALSNINLENKDYLLVGHFCLQDINKNIQKIDVEVFRKMDTRAIILLTESPSIIVKRRKIRDSIVETCEWVEYFQEMEKQHCEKVATIINVPYIVIDNADINRGVEFIHSVLKNNSY
jgi:Archaeal adenylate kinase